MATPEEIKAARMSYKQASAKAGDAMDAYRSAQIRAKLRHDVTDDRIAALKAELDAAQKAFDAATKAWRSIG